VSYSDFSLREVTRRFELTLEETLDLFALTPEIEPSVWLRESLARSEPLARAIDTEKARSEFLIAPILLEMRVRRGHTVSLFSGIDFPGAPELGLSGICDFIIARSPEQLFLTSPIVVIVEAMSESIKGGLSQCLSAMLGARLFNEREGHPTSKTFGVVTTGTVWQFLVLEGTVAHCDRLEYYVERLPKILGILDQMISNEDDRHRLAA
jgi:hypothetical protein